MIWPISFILPSEEDVRAFGVPRSSDWHNLSHQFLYQYPCCAVCGSRKKCVAHHILPVHFRKDLELIWTNLLTMCPSCHLFVGHLGDYRSWNEHVRMDAAEWREKIEKRPYRSG